MTRSRIAVLVLAALLGATACRRGGSVGPYPKAPLILVSIDTLRSDHLAAYGYAKGETPSISAFAQQSVLFDHAYSHVPLTLPSHTTMLTGLLPGDNGVRDNLGYRVRPGKHAYLPQFLRDAGYATGGAISAFVLRRETGFGQGFDFFAGDIELHADQSIGESQRSCADTLAVSKPWLQKVSDKPFFLLLHFYDPHSPYDPPPDIRARVAMLYDGDITVADRCFGDLERLLRASGVWDRAVVALVSDHGEGLLEHGEPEHGVLLYRNVLQVPFMIKLPHGERGGQRVGTPVQLVDLFPTFTALLGLPTPPGLPGRSVFALDPATPRPIFSETFYPRLHLGWSELTSVIEGSHHGIIGPDPELYDLERDPGEHTNIRDRERRIFASVLQADRQLSKPLVAPMAESSETAAQLAALGYAGGTVQATGSAPLPDPKQRVGSLREYSAALAASQHEDFATAVERAKKLTVENPLMVDAWDLLGASYRHLGMVDESLAAYRKGMEISGGTPHLAISIGMLLLQTGDLEHAAAHARMALADSPSQAHSLLASIAQKKGDLPGAEREAKLGVAAGGAKIAPLLVLAEVYRDEGRLDDALQATDQALQALGPGQPKYSGIYLDRGDIFARQGRLQDAVEAFRAEIDRFPKDPRAYSRLAALLVAAEHPQEAGAVLQELLARNPDSPAAVAAAVKSMRVLGDPETAQRLLEHARQLFPKDPTLAHL